MCPLQTTNGNFTPLTYVYVDYDDANTPVSVAAARERQNCIVAPFYKEFSISLVPRFATAAYSGAFTSYENSKGWIDCGSTNVVHYGVKYVMDQAVGTVYSGWNVSMRYFVSFRNVI